jgi:hypothetical protein
MPMLEIKFLIRENVLISGRYQLHLGLCTNSISRTSQDTEDAPSLIIEEKKNSSIQVSSQAGG